MKEFVRDISTAFLIAFGATFLYAMGMMAIGWATGPIAWATGLAKMGGAIWGQ